MELSDQTRDAVVAFLRAVPFQAVGAAFVIFWLRIDRRERGQADPAPPRWTRKAARLVLVTWPVAWVLLVLLVR